jgi:tetratricopeptide (TPR) repeat protein
MRKGRWVILGFLAVCLTAGALAWWQTHRGGPAAVPPDVVPDDPAVAEAVARARDEVVAHPQDPAAWGRLGQTLLANGLPGPSRACLAEAGRLDPNDPRWPYLEGVSLLQTDPVAALPCWQRGAACPGDAPEVVTARLRWAEALLANDRPAEAEGVLRRVRDAHPDSVRARFDLGLLAAARDRPGEGIESFRECLEDPSARRKASTHLAALYAAAGKTAEAAEASRRAEGLPPDADWADPILEETVLFTVGRDSLFLQAEKLQQQGHTRQAVLLFQEVIRQYPDEAQAYVKLGMILAEGGDYRGAEDVLRAGLGVNPDLVQGHFFLAVSLFHQAEQLGPASPAGRDKLGAAAAEAGRATELKPEHGFAHLYRGLALKQLGQRPEALAALRESVRCNPEATDPHLHLGQALGEEGKAEEAAAELETAVRLAAPNDPRPREALERLRRGGGKP